MYSFSVRVAYVCTRLLCATAYSAGVKMRSRGQGYFLVTVKRSRALTGAKRVKVKRLSRRQTQDLRCFIRDIPPAYNGIRAVLCSIVC